MSDGHSVAASTHFPSDSGAALPGASSQLHWRRLNAERRLQLVAQALRESDGIIDLFPLAL